MFFFICLSLLILYGFAVRYWVKKATWNIGAKGTKIYLYVHALFFFAACAATLLALTFDLYFRGYWTTKLIFIFFLLTGMAAYPLLDKSRIPKILKFYFIIFCCLPIATFLISLIPFLGIVIVISILGHLLGGEKIYYSDDEFRIERGFKGALAPPIEPVIVQKSGILEKEIYNADREFMIDSLEVTKRKDSVTVKVMEMASGSGTDSVETKTIKAALYFK